MLDVIQTKGTPKTTRYFLVYETFLQQFLDTDGDYRSLRFIVIASAHYGPAGELWDWAAYKGIPPGNMDDTTGRMTVANMGNKLSEREVKFYLHGQPNLNALLRRYRE